MDMPEVEVAQNLSTALVESGIMHAMETMATWIVASLCILVPSMMIMKVAQNIVYYMILMNDPLLQQVRFQRSTFTVSPEGWEDCTCLSWNWKGITIYVGSTNQVVSMSNTGVYGKEIMIDSQAKQQKETINAIMAKIHGAGNKEKE